ncbi:MAG: potassium channel family protein [Brevundimonas sp.]|uniref:potassium channel family protein n=1 Tax=Brevundimonas sp. TaxID=1871086 RepID=UPI00258840B2|nr:potassium channel family protein [Brevundimonas sp.]MCV0414481.1 potassium channel family protein [Brevundimonas sp.]
MIVELLIATVMVLATVALHGVGLLVIARVLHERDLRRAGYRISPFSLEGAVIASGVALALLTLHGVEIWLYAFLFVTLDAIATLPEAVYFSTISYATIGYSDAPILERWRLLGAIEGVNGTLLMGWSVAFFVTVMARVLPHRRASRRPARGDRADAP